MLHSMRFETAAHLAHDGYTRVPYGVNLLVSQVVVQAHVRVAGASSMCVEGPQDIKVFQPHPGVHLHATTCRHSAIL